MFDSLADRIREDEHKESTSRERLVRYLLYAVLPILLFGGLYYAIQVASVAQ